MRNARWIAVTNSIAALLAIAALVISLIVISGESAATRNEVCLYVNGIIDAFHTPQGRASAENIRVHYPALNDCRHKGTP